MGIFKQAVFGSTRLTEPLQQAVGEGGGGKNFLPHPNKLLIRAYPENLVIIGLLVEAVDTFCGTARHRQTLRLYRQPQP